MQPSVYIKTKAVTQHHVDTHNPLCSCNRVLILYHLVTMAVHIAKSSQAFSKAFLFTHPMLNACVTQVLKRTNMTEKVQIHTAQIRQQENCKGSEWRQQREHLSPATNATSAFFIPVLVQCVLWQNYSFHYLDNQWLVFLYIKETHSSSVPT